MVLDLLPNHSYLVAFSWEGRDETENYVKKYFVLSQLHVPTNGRYHVQKFWVF